MNEKVDYFTLYLFFKELSTETLIKQTLVLLEKKSFNTIEKIIEQYRQIGYLSTKQKAEIALFCAINYDY